MQLSHRKFIVKGKLTCQLFLIWVILVVLYFYVIMVTHLFIFIVKDLIVNKNLIESNLHVFGMSGFLHRRTHFHQNLKVDFS